MKNLQRERVMNEVMDEQYENMNEDEKLEFLFGADKEEMMRDHNERLRERAREAEVELAKKEKELENKIVIDKDELEEGKVVQRGEYINGKMYRLEVIDVI